MGITNVLYNRSEFLEKAQEFLDACESSGWCIISIDIERFKLFNNWYGHEAGDILLQNISQYLLRVQQMKGYLAGYFGGDHFFMCIPDDEQLINLIYKTIRSYIGIHSQNEGFLPIIGIYPITEKHPDTATMCNNAQLAASEIKGNFNKRICYFTNEIIDQLEKEQQMLHDVKVGLENKEFTFYLQPKCNSITGAIVSMEALSRWISPSRGFVSPGEFIPFLENNGMITALDTYIWDAVCQTLAYWKKDHLYVVPISINVSVADIETINVPEFLQDLLSNVPHEHYNHAHKAVSDDTTVTEPKSSVELLHETTVTHSIFKILAENFLLLARLNLSNAEYEILKRDYRLHGKELELEHNFELYNRRILNENLIHPDDVELYRSRITLSSLQDIFFGGHKQLTYQFRRCLGNDYISTTMEFLAGNKCDAQNPWIVVIIREKTV